MTTPSQKRKSNALQNHQSKPIPPIMAQSGPANHLNFQLDPQPGHPHLPLPLPVDNPLWPELPETEFLQNLNQSLKPFPLECNWKLY
ncbi:hypothetical protein O181_107053 [Austropuccinia psidii MF-1]|uniref:Uncharacterized protein n=1 Tax=Austropuccinia psidii MF-1 TaxID=1389203 RepID=A0A9Q3JQ40_9BASI|nr:hypothetical protein [Austropuccinia psidii MF-1]